MAGTSAKTTIATLPQRRLGKDGPLVPAMSFGLMMFSGVYGTGPSQEERFALLDRAVEIGATLWDTADMYGDCEKTVGDWFTRTGQRSKIFLATKFGIVKGDPTFSTNSSSEYCRKACAESLALLQTDYIDLYYLHHPNPETSIEETMRALIELKAEGKIRHIGLSNISGPTLRRAVKIGPVAAVQTDYSPFVLDAETSVSKNLLATCRELGVAVVAYSPLGRGLLTSTFAADPPSSSLDPKDMRPLMLPRFQGANRSKNVALAQQFAALADKMGGRTPSQLALAWLLKQGDDIIPNPGTKRVEYLESNFETLRMKELTDEEEREVRAFVEGVEVAGPAVPESFVAKLYVDTVADV